MRLCAVLLTFAIFLFTLPPAFSAPRDKEEISDGHIHDEVIRRLADDADVKGANLDVDVKDGVVTLRGRVDGDRERSKAEKLTKKVRGVKSVNNQLTFGE
jgi:osmotically-inducible protein OsmY